MYLFRIVKHGGGTKEQKVRKILPSPNFQLDSISAHSEKKKIPKNPLQKKCILLSVSRPTNTQYTKRIKNHLTVHICFEVLFFIIFAPFFQYTIAKSQNGVRGHHVLFDVGLEALVRGIGSFYIKPPMEGPLVLIWSRPNRVLEDRAMRKNQKRNGQVFYS